MFCHEHGTVDYCPECDESAKDVTIAKLQAVVDAAKHLVSKYSDELLHRSDVDALERTIKEVEK